MSFLAVQIDAYLQQTPVTARQLEELARLPRMTIGNILNDAHPRPERFGQLLHAVDDDTARKWLTAYLRDDCPPEFLPRLEITITAYTHGQLDTSPASVLEAWHRLQSAIQADTSLAKWFIKTVNLILGEP